MVDKNFKIGLLVLGFLYLVYLFCPNNQAGRYQYNEKYDTDGVFISKSVFDTSTSVLYLYDNGGGKKWNIIKIIKEDISDRKDIIYYRNMAEQMEKEEEEQP